MVSRRPVSADSFDVIVLGVGAMGSATVAELAARGVRVLGLERAGVPNDGGSSGGTNRVIRLAYSEDPRYVPLLRRAFERWRSLEERSGERLLVVTGGLDAGPMDGNIVSGSLESCRLHGLSHELLDAAAVRRRFPGFALPDDMAAVYQADAGLVMSERAIAAYAQAAIEDGAEIHGREPAIGWEPTTDGVVVRTERAEYRARRLVVSAGAWAPTLAPPLADLLVPERQVLIWTQPWRPERFRVGSFPVFIMGAPAGQLYGLPSYGIPGFKFGVFHHKFERVDPSTWDPLRIDTSDEAMLRSNIDLYFPDAAGPTLTLKACLFTNAPDGHFIVDTYPGLPQVILASPCSGHGFKFASVVGQLIADMATDRPPEFDLSMFSLDRFSGSLQPMATPL